MLKARAARAGMRTVPVKMKNDLSLLRTRPKTPSVGFWDRRIFRGTLKMLTNGPLQGVLRSSPFGATSMRRLEPVLGRALRLYASLCFEGIQKFYLIVSAYCKELFTLKAAKYFGKPHFFHHFTFLKILDRYIIAEVLRLFFTALLFFISLFISVALRESLGNLLAKNIDTKIVLLFFISAIIEQLPVILPPATLFASLLAVRRLSNDQELIAMRSLGMGYGRIYRSFASLGLLLCLCMMLFSFYLAPLNAQYSRALIAGLHLYESLAFVRAGRFFNRPVWSGNHIDIYAKNRDASVLKKVYIHRWNMDPSQGSKTIPYRGKERRVGASQTLQIIFAEKGEVIQKPRADPLLIEEGTQSKEANKKGNEKAEQERVKPENKAVKLPEGLAGRDLTDLSFVSILPKIQDERDTQKYIRLEKGFMLQFDLERAKIQTSNFRQGLMDYSLSAPPRTQGYFGISPHTFTLGQLIAVYYKFNRGGLVIDPFTVYGGREPRAQNYIEIPRKELLPLLKQNSLALSNLSTEEIYRKYGLYISAKENTPAKRQFHFNYLYKLGSHLLEKQPELLFLIHQRISLTFSILLFLLIAFPLGISSKRSGKGASFSLALFVYAFYSILDRALDLTFKKGELHPALAAWLPELALLIIGLLSLFRSQESRQFLASLLYPQQK